MNDHILIARYTTIPIGVLSCDIAICEEVETAPRCTRVDRWARSATPATRIEWTRTTPSTSTGDPSDELLGGLLRELEGLRGLFAAVGSRVELLGYLLGARVG